MKTVHGRVDRWRGFDAKLAGLAAIVAAVCASIVAVVVWGGRSGDDVAIRRATFVIQTGIDAFLNAAAREHAAAWEAAGRDMASPEALADVLESAFGHHDLRVTETGGAERLARGAPHPASPMADEPGPRRALYGPGFDQVARGRLALAAEFVARDGLPYVAVRSRWNDGSIVVASWKALDVEFLRALTRDYAVDEPRLARTDTARWPETSLPIVTDRGEPAGWFVWSPKRPGTDILYKVLPTVAPGILGLLVLAVWLLFKTAQRNADAAASEAHARHLAMHDDLTGLMNRRAIAGQLAASVDRPEGRGRRVAFALVDVDHFKDVNDTLGHQAGDALIAAVAERLSHALPGTASLGRLGGDEFAIIARDVGDERAVDALGAAVSGVFRAPFDLDGQRVHVTASVGIAVAPDHGRAVSTLMRHADIALYRAKTEGRGRHRIFARDMDEAVRLRRTMEVELRQAIDEGQIELAYQLVMDATGASPRAAEALVRWRRPDGSMVSPGVFVPIAEQSGLIVDLGAWVLRRAFLDSRRLAGLAIAVNLSPVQFRDPGLVATVERLTKETGVDPRRIELEVTESVLMDATEGVQKALDRLRGLGFRIALDDFGTGYSSLSYLRRFAFDRIKIDQTFVRTLESSMETAAIVKAVVSLGHALGMRVTAEGVETEGQHRLLLAAGCDAMQGYLFAKPMPIADVEARLDRRGGRVVSLRAA